MTKIKNLIIKPISDLVNVKILKVSSTDNVIIMIDSDNAIYSNVALGCGDDREILGVLEEFEMVTSKDVEEYFSLETKLEHVEVDIDTVRHLIYDVETLNDMTLQSELLKVLNDAKSSYEKLLKENGHEQSENT